jgi:HK97 gp10 family phage protein
MLRKNLKVRALKSRKYIGAKVTLDYTRPQFYGSFIEWGTKKITARHFLQKATDQVKDAALTAAFEVIKAEVEKNA